MNLWKVTTAGLALTAVTALTSSVTTAYLMRPAPPEPMVTPALPVPAPAVARAVRPTVVVRPAARVVRPPARVAAVAREVSTVAVPADCTTGGDRAWRMAKPGALGALLGAGVGAAGGAIAGGGKGAGQGALIGGLTGAVAGTAYGAYRTKAECGTVLGESGPPASGGLSAIAYPAR